MLNYSHIFGNLCADCNQPVRVGGIQSQEYIYDELIPAGFVCRKCFDNTQHYSTCAVCGFLILDINNEEYATKFVLGNKEKHICVNCLNRYEIKEEKCDMCGGQFISDWCTPHKFDKVNNIEDFTYDSLLKILKEVHSDGTLYDSAKTACSDCVSELSYCENCEEYHTGYSYYIENQNRDICDGCYENEDYGYCSNCGEYFYGDCPNCSYDDEYEDEDDYRIFRWDYKRAAMSFFGTGTRFFGVELEIECKTVDKTDCIDIVYETFTDDAVWIKNDGSLTYGIEIVFAPRTLVEWYKISDKLQKMCRSLAEAGARSHDTQTCGLHVHVSRKGLTSPVNDIVDYCRELWEKDNSQFLKFTRRKRSEILEWANPGGDNGRRDFINILPGETIECRGFKGTLKISNILAAISFVNTVIDIPETSSFETLYKIGDSRLKAYIEEKLSIKSAVS